MGITDKVGSRAVIKNEKVLSMIPVLNTFSNRKLLDELNYALIVPLGDSPKVLI